MSGLSRPGQDQPARRISSPWIRRLSFAGHRLFFSDRMLRAPTELSQSLERGLLQAAVLQCLLAVYCHLNFTELSSGTAPLTTMHWALMALLAGIGGLLVLGQRDEPAARLFGSALVLVAPAFGTKLLAGAHLSSEDPLLSTAALISWFPTEAFGSYFFWRFVARFPKATDSRWLRHLLRSGRLLSLVLALALVPLQAYAGAFRTSSHPMPDRLVRFLSLELEQPAGIPQEQALELEPQAEAETLEGTSPKDQFVFGLWFLALPVLGWRLHRHTTLMEQRRTRPFVFWLLVGLLPVLGSIALIPDSESSLARATTVPMRLLVLATLLGSVWFAFRKRVFDVQLLVQNLLSRLVVRDLLGVALFLPALLLGHRIWSIRHQEIVDLLKVPLGPIPGPLWQLFSVLLPLLRPALTKRVEAALDLEVDRPERDTYRLLDRIQEIEGREALLPLSEIELSTMLRAPVRIHPLDPTGTRSADVVAMRLAERAFALRRDPLILDHTAERQALGLEGDELRWLERSRAAVLAPLLSSTNRPIGLVVVEPRPSQRAFHETDRDLVSLVCRALAIRFEQLENRHRALVRPTPGALDQPQEDHDESASQCLSGRCGQLHPPELTTCPNCGSLTGAARVPLLLEDRLRFERVLGTGSLGTVYRARDLRLGRTVAVKALHSQSSERAFALLREATLTAAVDHPKVVQVHSAERWRHRLLLVGEYVAGGTLRDRLSQGPIPWAQVVQLACDLCDALDHAHGLPLVHGDIKASNIALTRTGQAKLLDFGLARMLHPANGRDPQAIARSSADPQSGASFRGTLLYLPPEALDGGTLSPANDLWALGLVMIESILGDLPLTSAERSPPRPDLVRVFQCLEGRSPKALVAILRKVLAQDPGRRYPDAARLRAALMSMR